jgi:hypothetical protein
VRLLARLYRWLKDQELTPDRLTVSAVDQFVQAGQLRVM